jgi:hypothetical protein
MTETINGLSEAEWFDWRAMALKVASDEELTDEEDIRWEDYEDRTDLVMYSQDEEDVKDVGSPAVDS